MTKDQETILIIKGLISELPAAQQEACEELILHLKSVIRTAGNPVGPLALSLVGAELQAENPG